MSEPWSTTELDADAGIGGRRRRLAGSSVAPSHHVAWSERHWTSRVLHRLGDVSARSTTGVAAMALVLVWAVVGLPFGYPGWWQTVLYSVAGSVTFVMVFVLQHAQERQTVALQRKLDELIRSSERADDALIAVEEAGDEQLQAINERTLADRAQASAESP